MNSDNLLPGTSSRDRKFGSGSDIDLDIPLERPKAKMEIGGSNTCNCEVPELEVSKDSVGDWYVQIVWCSKCTTRFGAAIEHESECDHNE